MRTTAAEIAEFLIAARVYGGLLAERAAEWFANATGSAVVAIPSKLSTALPHLTVHDRETADVICRDALENAGVAITAPGLDGGSVDNHDESGDD